MPGFAAVDLRPVNVDGGVKIAVYVGSEFLGMARVDDDGSVVVKLSGQCVKHLKTAKTQINEAAA